MEKDVFICGNSLEIIKTFPDNYFNLVVTSPPYFHQRKYTDNKDEMGLEENLDLYIEKLLFVFNECVRVVKNDGSVIINIGDKYQDANLLLIPYRFALTACSNEVKLINEITWVKTNPTPRQYQKRLISSKEPFFHFVKSKDYYYNLKELGESKIVKKTGSKIGSGYFKLINESELSNEEKELAKKELNEVIDEIKSGKLYSMRMKIRGIHSLAFGGQQGGRNNEILKKGFSIIRVPGEKLHKDTFEHSVETIKGIKHPAVYPLSLVEKLIKITTRPGDLILDPFMGSGTTALACKKNGRHFVGIDLNSNFVIIAQERINEYN